MEVNYWIGRISRGDRLQFRDTSTQHSIDEKQTITRGFMAVLIAAVPMLGIEDGR